MVLLMSAAIGYFHHKTSPAFIVSECSRLISYRNMLWKTLEYPASFAVSQAKTFCAFCLLHLGCSILIFFLCKLFHTVREQPVLYCVSPQEQVSVLHLYSV